MDKETAVLIEIHIAIGIVLAINYTLIIVMWKYYRQIFNVNYDVIQLLQFLYYTLTLVILVKVNIHVQ